MINPLDAAQINFNQGSLLLMNVVLAIIMFGIALEIQLQDFRALWNKPKLFLVGVATQFFLLPLLTFGLIVFLKPPASIALGMMLVAACPGGNISNFMSHLSGGNVALSVSLTAFATLIAIVATPFNFHLYASHYAPTAEILLSVHLDIWSLAKIVLLILAVPLSLGMYIRSLRPILASRLSLVLKPFSIVVFIIFVLIACFNNIDAFKQYLTAVIGYGLLHNCMALTLGFFMASMFRLSDTDRKTITLETGIQNSGLGLVLIFTFFDGLGGMALIAAYWGISHIVLGLLLSAYWSKPKLLKGGVNA